MRREKEIETDRQTDKTDRQTDMHIDLQRYMRTR